jgi:flagellar biosynthesis component FlhA
MKEEDSVGCALAIVGIPVVLLINTLADGLSVMLNWNWFAVPVLNAPHLTMVPAMGLSIVVGTLVASHRQKSDDDESVTDALMKSIGYIVIRAAFLILLGYIVKSWM